ncbi:MAG: ATP-binding protein [Candidatus Ratteibacteria bacterium]
MNYWVESLIITILIVGILAWIVYSRNKSRPPNRRFPVFAAALALWSCVGIPLMNLKDVIHLLFLLKVAGILGALLPAAFIFFAVGFEMPADENSEKRIKNLQTTLFFLSVSASLLTLHPSFIKSIIISENIQERLPGPDVVYGWPFVFYSLIIISTMVFGLRYFYRLMKRKTGTQKTEIQYVFLSIITGTIFAVVTTLIAPMLGTTIPCRFGSMSSIIMCSIITYAIARHRILNISVFAEKTFVYGCLVAGLMLVYTFLVWSLSHFVRIFTTEVSLFPAIASSFIIAIAFSPLKEIIQRWARKKIFRQQYDIEQILAQMGLIVGSSLNFEEGIATMMGIINNEIHIKNTPVFIIKPEQSAKKIFMGLKKSSMYRVEFDNSSPILKLLETEPFTHFKDELIRFSGREIIRSVLAQMDFYGAEVIVPMHFHNRIIGTILFDGREDEKSFSDTERRILNALSLYMGIFIETTALATTLRENRSYQQSLLENLPSGVIAVDDEHNVIVFNHEAERITGLKRENVLRRKYDEVVPTDLKKLLNSLLQNKNGIRNMETEFSKNGSLIPLMASGSCFYSSGGSLLGAQLIFSDISQLKILQDQVKRNERLASLGILAAGIAHEIRNPLVALKTFSQLLPEKFSDKEFRENYTRVVIPEIERIDGLVEQLLVFARPRPVKKEKTDLVSIIESTITLIKAQAKFDGISFIQQYEKKEIEIIADSEKLKQALWNILLNSAEAMEENKGTIKVQLLNDNENVVLTIQDNGCGIPEENLNKIFDPLFTTKPNGTGLGLPIVNEIIAQHNGRIFVESKKGIGTKVIIELPLNERIEK